ncbi:MAG TPA: NADH-quinone oxidoreductase subunit L [Thermoanaerobaculia bacterium]|nr:NADH-quinone oxidoreductase subunit L [Thermoanaerobaculia bacterium]
MIDLLWLVPLLPLLGAAANAALGPRVSKTAITAVGVGVPGVTMLLSLGILGQYLAGVAPQPVEQVLYAWTAGELSIDVAFLLDPLSAVMLFVVTFVGFWIHVYSAGYMAHEVGYQRYFVYLNLFMGAMLLLVLGNNFLVMFVGWEGVGLCSYLLIGFYYTERWTAEAGRKAFVVNRIGDFAFLVGMFALIASFGSLRYADVLGAVTADPSLATGDYVLGLSLASFVALCFFVGATGKSAQIPLYVWLPDAMAGPTPVSALIHAATMVTAGVYMVVRTNVLYQLASEVSLLLAVVGAATALFAATIGIAQTDIKKVLAYSTVSQLGYMFLAAGLGAYTAAIFHLVTHAFFKALLFLGSGSVIHAMGGEQDMRKMGGLKEWMPTTYKTFLVGSLAIAGIPPLAGFFSKDEILAAAAVDGQWLLWLVGLGTAALTAFYMFRAVFLTFHGSFRGTDEQRHHLHESPRSMTVPLWVLAVGSVVAGWIGIPAALSFGADVNWLHHFLEPVIAVVPGFEEAEHHLPLAVEWFLILLTVALAVGAISLAAKLYRRDRPLEGEDRLVGTLGPAHPVLENKYWVDELYDVAVVQPLRQLSVLFWKVVDGVIIDGAIHLGASLTELAGSLGRFTTTGNARNYLLYFFLGALVLAGGVVVFAGGTP